MNAIKIGHLYTSSCLKFCEDWSVGWSEAQKLFAPISALSENFDEVMASGISFRDCVQTFSMDCGT